MDRNDSLTLLELNMLVRRTVETALDESYWVVAELLDVRESNGHCYMELVQKNAMGNTPVARAQARCWRQTWALARPYFERATGEPLHAGLKVRLLVHAQFHEAYGFSWIIDDIDPTYTLGDMQRRRMEIVNALKAEGVFDLNKELPLPLFTQRVAVISSATAAGYGDFCNQLADNEYGFAFTTRLFPAVMQGEQVERSVIAALDRINEMADEWDCVVIIRGGGATSDMSGFDTLALAENVANFPLPVITGIGHDRDESVLDMVSHTRVKTPTAAAALLISRLKATADRIDRCGEAIVRTVGGIMERERLRMERLADRIPALFAVVRTRQEARLDIIAGRLSTATRRTMDGNLHHIYMMAERMRTATRHTMDDCRHRMDMMEQRAKALDPTLLLKRGYCITLVGGHAVRDAAQLKEGDEIVTRLEKGEVRSAVTSTKTQKKTTRK